ncbi:MAG: nucleotide pyrophosphohydrolase [Methanobacteriota archaeon]|nr:MAG: nucleotide pyrophosphohydrolase [Euryarchaeota archaeon]
MTDATTTVAALRSRVDTFVRARDWEKFHRLSNLAKAISVEAAELLELFQWRGESDPLDVRLRTRAEEELADVVIYCLSAANSLDLDLSDAVLRKLKRNEAKYPVREWRGRARDASRDDADLSPRRRRTRSRPGRRT